MKKKQYDVDIIVQRFSVYIVSLYMIIFGIYFSLVSDKVIYQFFIVGGLILVMTFEIYREGEVKNNDNRG